MSTNSKNWKILISYFVMMLVLVSAFEIHLVSANYVWTDDFEDEKLDSWFISRGAFSAEQKTLWASGTSSGVSNRAYHECNLTSGRWSFDILLKKEWRWLYHPPAIRFMVNSLDDITWRGYVLDFATVYHSIGSAFIVHLWFQADTGEFLSSYEFDSPANGWQSVGIQRTSNGRMTVYLNNSLIIDVTDNSINESKYFVFDTEDCIQTVYYPDIRNDSFINPPESPMLDNIVVEEIPELLDGNSTMFFIIISTAISGIALIIIGKEELAKIRT